MGAAVIAGIGAVGSLIGTAVSAYSSISSSYAAQAEAENARAVEEKQIQSRMLEAQIQEDNYRMAAAKKQKEKAKMASAQVAAAAKAGVSLQSQSLLDIMDETAVEYEKDRQTLLRSGRMASTATQYNAVNMRRTSIPSVTNGYADAASSVIKGVGSFLDYGDKAGWFS